VKTYWHIFNIGIQNTLTYRVNFLVRAVFNIVPLMAFIVLWRAIYADKTGPIAGYTLAQMISYYLLVTVIEATTSVTEDDWQIATDIKDGHISQFLTRPMDYLHYRLWLFFSGRAVYTLAAFVPVSLFVLWNHEYLLAPPSATAFGVFLLSLALSALLQFFLSYLIAMLAFWVVEISTFVFILLAFERLASGQMFPLDILPGWLSGALMWTPFPYAIFYPASIYMGGISGAALYQGLGMQVFWVCATYVLARTVWRQGLKTYTVVGG
jgi:ABC-2 type transport system permease protein